MHRLRADSHAVVVALQRQLLITAPGQQFGVHAELLRPVPRHAAADREYPHALGRKHRVREFFKVLKRIEAQHRALLLLPRDLCSAKSMPSSESENAGTKTGTLCS